MLLLLVLGVLFTALPHALVMHALRVIPATRVSLLLSLQVLYASVLAELPTARVCLGGAIIVATVASTLIASR